MVSKKQIRPKLYLSQSSTLWRQGGRGTFNGMEKCFSFPSNLRSCFRRWRGIWCGGQGSSINLIGLWSATMVVIEAGLGKSNEANLSLLRRWGRWTLKILSIFISLYVNVAPFPYHSLPIHLNLAELINPLLRILHENHSLAVGTENKGNFAILGIILRYLQKFYWNHYRKEQRNHALHLLWSQGTIFILPLSNKLASKAHCCWDSLFDTKFGPKGVSSLFEGQPVRATFSVSA